MQPSGVRAMANAQIAVPGALRLLKRIETVTIPKGFKLVPVEPTAEILAELAWDVYPDDNSAGKALQRLRGCDVVFPKYEVEAAVGKYQRMLAAAPPPPQPIYDEAKERELARLSYDADSEFTGGWFDYLYGWLACAQSRAKDGEVGHE